MSTYYDYEAFADACRESKKLGVIVGRVSNVNLRENTCSLTVLERTTNNLDIQCLIQDVWFNGMGAIGNPSALKKWKGWGKYLDWKEI